MGRIRSRGKGISASAHPYQRPPLNPNVEARSPAQAAVPISPNPNVEAPPGASSSVPPRSLLPGDKNMLEAPELAIKQSEALLGDMEKAYFADKSIEMLMEISGAELMRKNSEVSKKASGEQFETRSATQAAPPISLDPNVEAPPPGASSSVPPRSFVVTLPGDKNLLVSPELAVKQLQPLLGDLDKAYFADKSIEMLMEKSSAKLMRKNSEMSKRASGEQFETRSPTQAAPPISPNPNVEAPHPGASSSVSPRGFVVTLPGDKNLLDSPELAVKQLEPLLGDLETAYLADKSLKELMEIHCAETIRALIYAMDTEQKLKVHLSEVAELRRKHQLLSSEIDVLRVDKQRLHRELNASHSEKRTHEQRASEAFAEVARLSSDARSLRRELEVKDFTHQAELAKAQDDLALTSDELRVSKELLEQMNSTNMQLLTQNEQLQTEVDDLRAQLMKEKMLRVYHNYMNLYVYLVSKLKTLREIAQGGLDLRNEIASAEQQVTKARELLAEFSADDEEDKEKEITEEESPVEPEAQPQSSVP